MKKNIVICIISVFSMSAMDHSTVKKWVLTATSVNVKWGNELNSCSINNESTIADIRKKMGISQEERIVAYYRNYKTFWIYTFTDPLPDIANVKQVMSTYNTDTLALLLNLRYLGKN